MWQKNWENVVFKRLSVLEFLEKYLKMTSISLLSIHFHNVIVAFLSTTS
ncbi:hypothetical protein CLOLEP_01654 [[Clostridium] leptum DSM 753]|uniref:Uncharacterized protein n=1 Tax=[Clostridium] leptum DSM 753 TaxID=428125 RepID=A7VSW3_9FIRM|nr:hypothetical protein CLOLEP_01654 [[Clostridium] leptum DSM 753]